MDNGNFRPNKAPDKVVFSICHPSYLFLTALLIIAIIPPYPPVRARETDHHAWAVDGSRRHIDFIADFGQPLQTAQADPSTEAPTGPSTGDVQPEDPPAADASTEPNIVDQVHEDVTRKMVDTAEWFDSFFDDERYLDEENQTTLRLQFDTFFQEYESVDFGVRARLDLKVPGLEGSLKNRFKITISGDQDESPALDDFDEEETNPIVNEDVRRNITLAAQYFFLDTLKRNASVRSGLTFRSLRPVAFGEVRYKAEDTFDIATTRFIPRARWWTDRGWDLRADFDIEAPLAEKLFFRTTLAGSWRQDKDGFFYDLRYRIFQGIDEKRALEYQWDNNFQTDPIHRLTRIGWKIKYREQIWRRWLFYEIAPEVALREFEDGRDYRFVPAILFRLEVRFDRKDLGLKKASN